MGLKDTQWQMVLLKLTDDFIEKTEFTNLQRLCNKRKPLSPILDNFRQLVGEHKKQEWQEHQTSLIEKTLKKQNEADCTEAFLDEKARVTDDERYSLAQNELVHNREQRTSFACQYGQLQQEKMNLQTLQQALQHSHTHACEADVHVVTNTHGHAHHHGHGDRHVASHSTEWGNVHGHAIQEVSAAMQITIRLNTIDGDLARIDFQQQDLSRKATALEKEINDYPYRQKQRARRASRRELREKASSLEGRLSEDNFAELDHILKLVERAINTLEKQLLDDAQRTSYVLFLQELAEQLEAGRIEKLEPTQKEVLKNLVMFHQRLSKIEQDNQRLQDFTAEFHRGEGVKGQHHNDKELLDNKHQELTERAEVLKTDFFARKKNRNQAFWRLLFSSGGEALFIGMVVLSALLFTVPTVVLIAFSVPLAIGMLVTLIFLIDTLWKTVKFNQKESELQDNLLETGETEGKISNIGEKIKKIEDRSPQLREKIAFLTQSINDQKEQLQRDFPSYTSDAYKNYGFLGSGSQPTATAPSEDLPTAPSYPVQENLGMI